MREMMADEGMAAATAGRTRCRATSTKPPPSTGLVIPVAGKTRHVRANNRTRISPNQKSGVLPMTMVMAIVTRSKSEWDLLAAKVPMEMPMAQASRAAETAISAVLKYFSKMNSATGRL